MLTVVGSLKGGSGKSTITFNLAVWLATRGVSVAVVDADPQATLSDVLQVRAEDEVQPHIEQLAFSALSDPDELKRFDHVLIDVGTASMERLKAAIAMADRVLVPVPPSQADIWSTQRFLRFVAAHAGEPAPLLQALINRADTHHAVRESDEAAEALRSLPGVTFIEPRLAQRTLYRRAFSEGLAVFEQKPSSKGAAEWHGFARALFPEFAR